MKEDTAGLKSDMAALLKQRWESPASSSVDTTPPSRKKLPTELSVSLLVYHTCIHLLLISKCRLLQHLQEKSVPEHQFKGSEG